MIIYLTAYDYVMAYEPEMESRHVCGRGMGWTLAGVFSQEAEGIVGGAHPKLRRARYDKPLSNHCKGRVILRGCYSNPSMVQHIDVHLDPRKERI